MTKLVNAFIQFIFYTVYSNGTISILTSAASKILSTRTDISAVYDAALFLITYIYTFCYHDTTSLRAAKQHTSEKKIKVKRKI